MRSRTTGWLIAAAILLIAGFLAMQVWSLRVGMLRFKAGDIDGALPILKIARILNPFNEFVPVALAEIDIKKGRFEEAESQIEALIERNPENAKLHNLLGVTRFARGYPKDAMKEYNEAIRIDPGYAIAHLNKGYLLLKSGKTNEGIGSLREAVRLDPKLEKNVNEIKLRLNLSPHPIPKGFTP